GLGNQNYTLNMTATDQANNSNTTTIGTITGDSNAPTYSNATYPSNIGSGAVITLSIIVNDTNLNKVWVEITNTTGGKTNYTMTYQGNNTYAYSFNCVGVGTYYYGIYMNDTSGNQNYTNNINMANQTNGTYYNTSVVDLGEGQSGGGSPNPPSKKANGEECISASDCNSGICLHNICRASDPYCGDGFCDNTETCSRSVGGQMGVSSIKGDGDMLYVCATDCCIVNNGESDPYCGDGFCDIGETLSSCSKDCIMKNEPTAPPPAGGSGATIPDAICGDGICQFKESYDICPADCNVSTKGISLGVDGYTVATTPNAYVRCWNSGGEYCYLVVINNNSYSVNMTASIHPYLFESKVDESYNWGFLSITPNSTQAKNISFELSPKSESMFYIHNFVPNGTAEATYRYDIYLEPANGGQMIFPLVMLVQTDRFCWNFWGFVICWWHIVVAIIIILMLWYLRRKRRY
ncbi:MAG: hypothetical protein CVU81_00500, partial [Euryarchaeota archaeon HGW-Euryarchaeota-1]